MTKEQILNNFPEVMWDRWIGSFRDFTIFGWVKRKDERFDFLVLDIVRGEVVRFRTSSAKLSKSISERLNFTHEECRRVEDHFDSVNCIKLKQEKTE